jgi:predicted transcriptional regulator
MRKSKLEVYQDILEGLKSKALSLDCLSYETGIDCRALRRKVNFLMENDLIRERVLKSEIRFALSSKGLAVLGALNVQKHFEIVKTALMAVEEPLQAKTTATKSVLETNDTP